jgi:2-polyprenyl-3-methyl-5-hydroxy-6-metoxy-1,4-benzoquinol methylase
MPRLVKNEDYRYNAKYYSYTHYNYLKNGILGNIKRLHFDIALDMTKEYFNHNVCDMGCCDGPLLPTLSKYFKHVLAVDINQDYLNIADELVKVMHLDNVEIKLNDNNYNHKNEDYKVVFLLEVMEHVGDKNRLYESKMEFIKNAFKLIDEDGAIIISVPKMTGPSFLLQRIGLALFNMNRGKISMKNILKASFFYDTKYLEKQWNGDHLGFNDKTFEKYLNKEFHILNKKDIIFQVIYKIKK